MRTYVDKKEKCVDKKGKERDARNVDKNVINGKETETCKRR
jgi:hypothetical protein